MNLIRSFGFIGLAVLLLATGCKEGEADMPKPEPKPVVTEEVGEGDIYVIPGDITLRTADGSFETTLRSRGTESTSPIDGFKTFNDGIGEVPIMPAGTELEYGIYGSVKGFGRYKGSLYSNVGSEDGIKLEAFANFGVTLDSLIVQRDAKAEEKIAIGASSVAKRTKVYEHGLLPIDPEDNKKTKVFRVAVIFQVPNLQPPTDGGSPQPVPFRCIRNFSAKSKEAKEILNALMKKIYEDGLKAGLYKDDVRIQYWRNHYAYEDELDELLDLRSRRAKYFLNYGILPVAYPHFVEPWSSFEYPKADGFTLIYNYRTKEIEKMLKYKDPKGEYTDSHLSFWREDPLFSYLYKKEEYAIWSFGSLRELEGTYRVNGSEPPLYAHSDSGYEVVHRLRVRSLTGDIIVGNRCVFSLDRMLYWRPIPEYPTWSGPVQPSPDPGNPFLPIRPH